MSEEKRTSCILYYFVLLSYVLNSHASQLDLSIVPPFTNVTLM